MARSDYAADGSVMHKVANNPSQTKRVSEATKEHSVVHFYIGKKILPVHLGMQNVHFSVPLCVCVCVCVCLAVKMELSRRAFFDCEKRIPNKTHPLSHPSHTHHHHP